MSDSMHALLAATPLLDLHHPDIEALVAERGWRTLRPNDRIGTIYDFVRKGETPQPGHPGHAESNPVAARLLPVRRLLAIVLLALLPLQFSWAAVASYCGHETQAAADHFGHHDHQHHADASSHADAVADRVADSESIADAAADVQGDKAPGAMDLDCGHCHGNCGVMLTLPAAIPGALRTARPSATVDETGGAHSPTRPERPQWLPLA